MEARTESLQSWLKNELGKPLDSFMPIVGDASFRRYFRVHCGNTCRLAVDAPPEHENIEAFVKIAHLLGSLGLNVPSVYAVDYQRGYMLIDDFGDTLYLNQLSTKTADPLYKQAIDTLITLQQCQTYHSLELENFCDYLIREELNNFKHWLLEAYLNINVDAALTRNLEQVFDDLINSAKQQPMVLVHRDYHSRNLMLLSDKRLGIIDFQDAVVGPISYDLVSLLRDCYIDWPHDSVTSWIDYYLATAKQQKLIPTSTSIAEFIRWFDLMGIQRHLKASFIFARKWLRDDDPSYLQYLPRTLNYVINYTKIYPELRDFSNWLKINTQCTIKELL